MAEYIERDAFLDAIEHMKPYHQEADDIAEMLQNFPAADVQPVRHGRWVTREVLVNPIDGIWRTLVECSECGGEAFKHEVYGYQRDNFCHLCGADLRETEK
jgi:hypothetical protein